jgi:hypothetical protein
MVLQCRVLGCMSKSFERRWSHMLRSNVVMMLLVIDHVRRGDVAESRRWVLMETCRHHCCDWWNSEARESSSPPQNSLNSRFWSSMAEKKSQPLGGSQKDMSDWWQKAARSDRYKAGTSKMHSTGLGRCRQRCQRVMQVSRSFDHCSAPRHRILVDARGV